MASFHGNFFIRSIDLLAMPAVPQDQSYAIEIQIKEIIMSPFVMFQTAVLHTYHLLWSVLRTVLCSAYNIDISSVYVRSPSPSPPRATSPNFRFG
jgi:hypothetical protein